MRPRKTASGGEGKACVMRCVFYSVAPVAPVFVAAACSILRYRGETRGPLSCCLLSLLGRGCKGKVKLVMFMSSRT